jgi:hypothetical protein
VAKSYIGGFKQSRPENIACQLETWYAHDVSANSTHEHKLEQALGAIEAKVLFMPCETDR